MQIGEHTLPDIAILKRRYIARYSVLTRNIALYCHSTEEEILPDIAVTGYKKVYFLTLDPLRPRSPRGPSSPISP